MPIPVHIITGFLGAGKTTLLNRLLKSGAFADTAIIVNEFGDVGIDHLLIETSARNGDMIELSDGCLCCTVRGDLIDTLEKIAAEAERGKRIDRVIIETTGLADPVPVLQAIIGAPALFERFRLAGLVAVVCAVSGIDTLAAQEEARQQVALADTIIVTKTDLPEADFARLRQRLAALNAIADIRDANAPGFALEIDDTGASGVYASGQDLTFTEDEHHHHHDHGDHDHAHGHLDITRHDASIEAFTLRHDAPIPAATVEMFVDLLRSSMPGQVLRMKGIVLTAERPARPMVIHGAGPVYHPPVLLDAWDGRGPETRLVVIARNGNRRKIADLFAAFAGQVATDTPDRDAVIANPLAIPGF